MTLQKESGVALNCVIDRNKFLQDIAQGNWERVLPQISYISLPENKVIDLFEQICLELAEAGEHSAARLLVEKSYVAKEWETIYSQRYHHLILLLDKKIVNPADIYPPGVNRERRRLDLVRSYQKEIQEAKPSRLMEVISQALRFQQLRGSIQFEKLQQVSSDENASSSRGVLDLFFEHTYESDQEIVPSKIMKTLKMGEASLASSLIFSPDGQYLVSGSTDGFIEVWNFEKGSLSTELQYQAKGQFLLHSGEQNVTCLSFAPDGEILASATSKGEVKIWKFYSGEICWIFQLDHSNSVSCLCLSNDGTKLLVGSGNGIIRYYGLKSGVLMKTISTEFHSSEVVSLQFINEDQEFLAILNNGSYYSFNLKTGSITAQRNIIQEHDTIFKGSQPKPENSDTHANLGREDVSIQSCYITSNRPDVYVIATHAPLCILYTPSTNTILQQYTPTIKTSASNISENIKIDCVVTSQRGKYVYACSDDGIVYCFLLESGTQVKAFRAHPSAITRIACHPYKNIIATTSSDGKIKLWK